MNEAKRQQVADKFMDVIQSRKSRIPKDEIFIFLIRPAEFSLWQI